MTALRRRLAGVGMVLTGLTAGPATAAGEAPHLDGALLGLGWGVPFAGILLSIALMPLLVPRLWHHHYGKIAALWALAFLLPFAAVFGPAAAVYELMHTLLLEYIPFIVLIFALFTVAGGVRLTGSLQGTPGVNTALLALGTVAASIMGTTGASMLLIRPLLRANAHRRYRAHCVVFFIFLVANIGGSLTPLGDPPLFLGFLKGVSFFWPTVHLFAEFLVSATILLALFYSLDRTLFRREGSPRTPAADEVLGVEGGINLILLGGIVAVVLMSGLWGAGAHLTLHHVEVPLIGVARDLLLIAIAGLSLRLTNPESRRLNGFSWGPIEEVAKLFAGIFLTIVPVIAILRAGEAGALRGLLAVVTDNGQPVDAMYFWMAGILSSFLDNAPTYLVFFNAAGGDAQVLMGERALTLAAISAGAVFMGANTYIGNAPNFMVRSIAETQGIRMPSFFGYMLWSGGILVPLFGLLTLIFFIR